MMRAKTTWHVRGLSVAFVALATIVCSLKPVSAAFQEDLWGARPAGLGGAFTAVADDANAPAYNPAGVSLIPDSELTFMYAQLYTGLNLHAGEDTSHLGLGYFSYVPSIKDKKYGSYAVSWTNFVATNLYREDSFALTAADSYQFDGLSGKPVLAYGANLKMLRRSFTTGLNEDPNDQVLSGGTNSTALTADFGVILKPRFASLPGLSFGLAGFDVTEPNLGVASSDRVPARYTVGAAYQDDKYRLINPSVELSRRNGRTLLSGGWEAWVSPDVLALRLGGNRDQIGGGLGYQFQIFRSVKLRLDYALLWPLNVDGTNGSHRISITSSF